VELLVALLLFSVAIAGLTQAQLAGKRAVIEAYRRDVALALGRDLLERIRANPAGAANYSATADTSPAPPPTDCRVSDCGPIDLAAWDTWHWHAALAGAAEIRRGTAAGGLPGARACVAVNAGLVRVAVLWRGSRGAQRPLASPCPAEPAGLYDAPGEAPGSARLRRQLVLFAWVGSP